VAIGVPCICCFNKLEPVAQMAAIDVGVEYDLTVDSAL